MVSDTSASTEMISDTSSIYPHNTDRYTWASGSGTITIVTMILPLLMSSIWKRAALACRDVARSRTMASRNRSSSDALLTPRPQQVTRYA